MSEANGDNLQRLVGRTVGVRPKGDPTRGRWWWCTVKRAQLTPWGCRLWVTGATQFGGGRWVAGKDVRPRTKRDAAILAEANEKLTGQQKPEKGKAL